MQSPPALIRSHSHLSQSSCQTLIARAVVDYTADVTCNVGVVASCSLRVEQTLWWYAKLCCASSGCSLSSEFPLATCCRTQLGCIDVFCVSLTLIQTLEKSQKT